MINSFPSFANIYINSNYDYTLWRSIFVDRVYATRISHIDFRCTALSSNTIISILIARRWACSISRDFSTLETERLYIFITHGLPRLSGWTFDRKFETGTNVHCWIFIHMIFIYTIIYLIRSSITYNRNVKHKTFKGYWNSNQLIRSSFSIFQDAFRSLFGFFMV